MCECNKSRCSKIVKETIEGNRRVWYTENGERWTDLAEGQHNGREGSFTSNGEICDVGYGSRGLF